MDIVTQGLAGAVVAQSAASRAPARAVLALGAFAGLLADADVLVRSADDPLVTLEFHRHFTHALLFVPVGGLLAAVLAWPFVRRHLRFRAAYGLATLGYLPSGLLDACTSYGTHLLWPLSDARVAWNLIAVVDPVFSLILLGAVVVAFVRRHAAPARIGLALALAYLAAGVVQRERAEAVATALARERGHVVTRLEVKPTLGNLVLWRSIYQTGDRFVVDAVRVGVVGSPAVYPGESLARFTPAQLPDLPAESVWSLFFLFNVTLNFLIIIKIFNW